MKFLPRFFSVLCLGFGLSAFLPNVSMGEGELYGEAPLPGLNSILSNNLGQKAEITSSVSASTETYTTGKPFYLAVDISFPSPWHGYWLNPGTIGIPMSAKLASVPGFEISPTYWSTPIQGNSDLGTFYGYDHATILWVVTPKTDAPAEASFKATTEWQICKDGQCLNPETKEFHLTIKQGDASANPKWQEQETKVSGLEAPAWAEGGLISADLSEDKKSIVLIGNLAEGQVLPNAKAGYFFSMDNSIFPPAEQKWESPAPGEFRLTLSLNEGKDELYPSPQDEQNSVAPSSLRGVLSLAGAGLNLNITLGAPPILLVNDPQKMTQTSPEDKAPDKQGDAQTTESTPATAEAKTEQPANEWGFDQILPQLQNPEFLVLIGLLFLGGLILNLMPCVFPVIGLKVLSFVQMGGGSRAKVFAHSFAFVVGVIISFWIVTILLFGLKMSSAGEVNWAFWMENVWVIYLLLLLMIAMGLSMYGVFEIGVKATSAGGELTQKKGFMGSFWSGVLATVIATPCSAPFLGGVMAPAMALPFATMFIAFTAMGMGMAFPYIVLGLIPGLVKYLPRPGGWMESFKQGLSFLLFGTAAWLLWVLLSFYDDSNLLLNALVGLVLFACGLWVYGRWCPIYRAKLVRFMGFIVAIIFIGGGIYLSLPPKQTPAAPSSQATVTLAPAGTWMDWSPTVMQQALDAGHPVYVDYTARWCLTCQVNKKAGYNEEVMSLFRKGNVILMRADKTKPNAEIDAELARLHRAAVPVNVLYRKGLPPLITSEILTPNYLTQFLQDHLFNGEESK